MTDLILASASSTRAALLTQAGLSFDIMPARIDEAAIKQSLIAENAHPRNVADTLAELKALRISRSHPQQLVLGADQVLALRNALVDKPASRANAADQLRRLRGEQHSLYSAAVIALGGEVIWRFVDEARLTMRRFSDAFLENYLDATAAEIGMSVGGYRVEGPGIQLFERIEGNWFTIMGLPLMPLLVYLRDREVLST